MDCPQWARRAQPAVATKSRLSGRWLLAGRLKGEAVPTIKTFSQVQAGLGKAIIIPQPTADLVSTLPAAVAAEVLKFIVSGIP